MTLTAENPTGSSTLSKNMYMQVKKLVLKPVADFSADKTTVEEAMQVQFLDLSENKPTSWTWTFPGGNPSASTDQNPTITYNSEGIYDVSLSVSNSVGGDSITKTGYIEVMKVDLRPQADFTSDKTVAKDGEVATFSDLSTNNPTAWRWEFPLGRPSISDEQNPTVEFSYAGVYNITLIASNSEGSDTIVKEKYMTITTDAIKPVIDFVADTTIIGVGEHVEFIGSMQNEPTAAGWAFYGGDPYVPLLTAPIGLTDTVKVRYDSVGVYDVHFWAHNAAGSDVEYKEKYIMVLPKVRPPVSDFSVSQRIIEEGETITFSDLSANEPTEWTWTFSGGEPMSSTDQHPSVQYNTPGIYDVSLTSGNAAGDHTKTKSAYITVNKKYVTPITDFYADTTKIKKGGIVRFMDRSQNEPTHWLWSFRGGMPLSSVSKNPIIAYPDAGVFDVALISFNPAGKDTMEKKDYIFVDEVSAASDLGKKITQFVVFPNPAQSGDRVSLNFYLEEALELKFFVIDHSGRVIKLLVINRFKAGENILSFDSSHLSDGKYQIIILNDEYGMLKSEEVVIH